MSPEEKGRVYWEHFEDSPWGGENGSSLKQKDDTLEFVGRDFDREDQRQNTATASFKLTEFRNALKDLQESGKANIDGAIPGLNEGMFMMMDRETKLVEISVSARVHQFYGISFKKYIPLENLLD